MEKLWWWNDYIISYNIQISLICYANILNYFKRGEHVVYYLERTVLYWVQHSLVLSYWSSRTGCILSGKPPPYSDHFYLICLFVIINRQVTHCLDRWSTTSLHWPGLPCNHGSRRTECVLYCIYSIYSIYSIYIILWCVSPRFLGDTLLHDT